MTPHTGRSGDPSRSAGTAASGGPAGAAAPARLAVDWTRCDGHGLCAALLPGRVARDEWGFPVVLDPAVQPDAMPEVRAAAAACPALALYLDDAAATARTSR